MRYIFERVNIVNQGCPKQIKHSIVLWLENQREKRISFNEFFEIIDDDKVFTFKILTVYTG